MKVLLPRRIKGLPRADNLASHSPPGNLGGRVGEAPEESMQRALATSQAPRRHAHGRHSRLTGTPWRVQPISFYSRGRRNSERSLVRGQAQICIFPLGQSPTGWDVSWEHSQSQGLGCGQNSLCVHGYHHTLCGEDRCREGTELETPGGPPVRRAWPVGAELNCSGTFSFW